LAEYKRSKDDSASELIEKIVFINRVAKVVNLKLYEKVLKEPVRICSRYL